MALKGPASSADYSIAVGKQPHRTIVEKFLYRACLVYLGSLILLHRVCRRPAEFHTAAAG
jgi:hypothetical protein